MKNTLVVHANQLGRFAFSRRRFLKFAGAGAVAVIMPKISLANNPAGQKLHGLSSFGDLKYPADYPFFDYGTADAPQGGVFRFSPSSWGYNQNVETFNTLNSFVLKGDAPPRMEMLFDTLMTGVSDEPDSIYCRLAKSIEISPDRNTYRFELRPEAHFHDGSPITADDVVFSYLTLKEDGHTSIAIDLLQLTDAVAIEPDVVELRFSGKQSDRAILSVATSIPIFSRAYYKDLKFKDHVMQIPLGSGAYKVGKFSPGIFIEYDRVRGHWAEKMPFSIGFDHFDTIRIDFYSDRQPAFEAFKKGDVQWRQEFTSKFWATEYVFPAVKDGRVVQREFSAEKRPSFQAWAMNMRRTKFADARTREAIALAFDFEWTNKNFFYGAYQRSNSNFERSNFAASGLPSPAELALLEPLRDQLPPEVFGEAVMQYVTDGSGRDRNALRKAKDLLKDAGWISVGGVLQNEQGERLTIEFLERSQVFEKVLGAFIGNLKLIGVPASVRLVDASQYQSRLDNYEFDMVGAAFNLGSTPTEEGMKAFFHSEHADKIGGRNYPGIKSPALDALIDKIDGVASREELETVMKTIDRVLRVGHFWIPQWFSANHRVAMWDIFGWKEPKPDFGFAVESLWWIDETKAAAKDIQL